jgi:hypothetical protein
MASTASDVPPCTTEEHVPEPALNFTGHFDVTQLNEHLRLCLRPNQGQDQPQNGGDTVDRRRNGETENGQAIIGTQVEVVMDEYIQIFLQLYK